LDTAYPRPKHGQIPSVFSSSPTLPKWYTTIQLVNTYTIKNLENHKRQKELREIFCPFPVLWLLQWKTADGVFADTAEVEGAVVLNDVRNFGEAVRGAVLEVFDDAALRIQAEDE